MLRRSKRTHKKRVIDNLTSVPLCVECGGHCTTQAECRKNQSKYAQMQEEASKRRVADDLRNICDKCFGHCTTQAECDKNRLDCIQREEEAFNRHVVDDPGNICDEDPGHCTTTAESHNNQRDCLKTQKASNKTNVSKRKRKRTVRKKEVPVCSLQSVQIPNRTEADVSKPSFSTQKDSLGDIAMASTVSSQDEHKQQKISSSTTKKICMPCSSIGDLRNENLLRTDYQCCPAECSSQYD